MKLFRSKKDYVAPVAQRGGWWPMFVNEAFSGAWQKNIKWKREDVMAHFAVFSCISLIASDISKLWVNLVREDSDGIWVKVPYDGVLNNPNHYQNRIQFFENWLISKLARGNTYVLKGRDSDGAVNRLYVLNPDLVTPLVSDSGEVFYQLNQDNLSGVEAVNVTVPASEIIHDRFNCLYHPLVGLSPIYACGLSAFNGLEIQKNSATHFGNMSRPGGIITVPGAIKDEQAMAIKTAFENGFGGKNYGKTAVLGDDMKYEPISFISAVDSQMIEQLKLSADIVCATFHVPPYKVIGNAPAYNNIEALEASYYSQALQVLIESIELLLDENLDIKTKQGFEFDIDGLLRMDQKTQIETLKEGVGAAIFAPNEARKRLNMKPVDGGASPMIQQQNYSLAALAKRDAGDDPFGTAKAEPVETVEPVDEEKQLMQSALAFGNMVKEMRFEF